MFRDDAIYTNSNWFFFHNIFLLVGFRFDASALLPTDDYSAAATARASDRQDVGAVQAGTEAVAPDPQERKETVMSSVTVWQALFSAVLDAPQGRVSDYFLMPTLWHALGKLGEQADSHASLPGALSNSSALLKLGYRLILPRISGFLVTESPHGQIFNQRCASHRVFRDSSSSAARIASTGSKKIYILN
jgi:hypothetical protein